MKVIRRLFTYFLVLSFIGTIILNTEAKGITNIDDNLINKGMTIAISENNEQCITPQLVFDKTAYVPGEKATMALKLTGTQAGDKTNSVTFEVEYDSEAFELVTGNANNDIKNGYMQFTSKTDLASGSRRKIQVMYVNMIGDTNLVEGGTVFTVDFKVKSSVANGVKTFTLKPVNMLDSSFKVYNINNSSPLNQTVEVKQQVSQCVTPQLVFDKTAYAPGEKATMALKLTGTQAGDKTNSVTFEVEYDSEAFELATGNASNDIKNGYIQFTSKTDMASGSKRKIQVMYVNMSGDTNLVEGGTVFTVDFKVKSSASNGVKTFTLKPVNMLDSSFKVYNINNSSPLDRTVEIKHVDKLEVVGTTPQAGAVYVSTDCQIVVKFNKTILYASNNFITLTDSSYKSVGFTTNVIGNTLTIKPKTSLANSKVYTVRIEQLAVVSDGDVKLGEAYVFSFTTSPKLLSLKAIPSSLTLEKGNSSELKVNAVYDGKIEKDITDDCVYSSSKISVAQVTSDGTVKAISAGTATIYCKYGGKSVNVSVTVTPVLIDLIVSLSSVQVEMGKTASVKVTAYFDNNTKKDVTSSAIWVSDNIRIAIVSKGTIKGISEGETVVTVGYGSKEIDIPVKVIPKLLGITAIPSKPTLQRGDTCQINITATFTGNKNVDVTNECQYSSSKMNVARISDDGIITAVSPGTANISCKYGGKTASVNVNVTPVLIDLMATMEEVEVEMKKSVSVKVTAYYDNNTKKDVTSTAVWISENAYIATVSKGVIKGINEGNTIVKVSFAGEVINIPVKVMPKLLSIKANTTSATIGIGSSYTLKIFAVFEGGEEIEITDQCTYSLSSKRYISLENGVVTAISKGSTSITVKYMGKSTTVKITVI